jgi:Holliday junction resolvase RusA-like endonuclease
VVGFTPPDAGMRLEFFLPMPPSWSKKKRARMKGQPHRQKPDIDNLVKSFLDALLGDDSTVWHLAGQEKRWSEHGYIVATIEA